MRPQGEVFSVFGFIQQIRRQLALLIVLALLPCAAEAQTIRVAGSGAALALLHRLATAFEAQAPGYRLEIVPGLGSGGAISAVAAGAIDLALSARGPNDAERAQGARSVPVFDTPFLLVANHPVPVAMASTDIATLYRDAKAAYQNGDPLRIILRPRSDAANLYLAGALPGLAQAIETARQRPDLPTAPTDQENMQLLNALPGGFAGMSLLQLTTESNALQRVRLDGVDGTLEAMTAGRYPLRMRFHLVRGAQENGRADAFERFMGTPQAHAIMLESGALALPAAARSASR